MLHGGAVVGTGVDVAVGIGVPVAVGCGVNVGTGGFVGVGVGVGGSGGVFSIKLAPIVQSTLLSQLCTQYTPLLIYPPPLFDLIYPSYVYEGIVSCIVNSVPDVTKISVNGSLVPLTL